MKTITNVLANINPSSLAVIGGYPAMDVSLIDANFTQLLTDEIVVAKTGNYIFAAADMDRIFQANSAGAIAFTLISPASVASGNWLWIENIGAGTLTLTGTVNGTVNPTVAQYDGYILYTNGASWFGFPIKAIPALATLATTATNLAMTGEDKATSASATVSLTQMNVKSGDKILVGVFGSTAGAGTTGGTCALSWAGSATAVLFDTVASAAEILRGAAITAIWIGSGTFPLTVTGDGTLTITNTISNVGSGAATYTNEIWAVFLKKQ